MTNASNKSVFQHTKTISILWGKMSGAWNDNFEKSWHCVNEIHSYQFAIYSTDKYAFTQQNAYVPCLNKVPGVISKLSFQHKSWFPDYKNIHYKD